MNAYRMTKHTLGLIAKLGGFAYLICWLIARSDGIGDGFEIPDDVNTICVAGLALTGMTAILMWLAEWVQRQVVREVVSDGFELLVAAATSKLDSHQQQLQQMVKAEVAAALQEVSAAAFRAAVVRQASEAATAATRDADASVTPIGRR